MTNRPHHPAVAAAAARVLSYLELIGLAAISIATLIAAGMEIADMVEARQVTLADLLLLFIYLEVLSMVMVYLESGALPVRMPLYIAMVALARYLILDMKGLTELQIIAIAIAVFVLAAAVLLIRYGHVRFPYEVPREGTPRER